MENKKILVTGGSGQVGRHLREVMPNATYVSSSDCNLLIQKDVDEMFHNIKPDVVVHLAAKVGGITDNMSYPAEYFDKNILMNTFVLRASKDVGVKQFIGILSSCIYPDTVDRYPMTENDIHKSPPSLTHFSYGYAKRCLAVQIEAYNQQYGTKFQYLIPSNLYSEYDKYGDNSHFVAALIKKIHIAKVNGDSKIVLYGTGNPLRQFIYSKDLVYVIKKCVDDNIQESFNVACSENLSILEMTKIALKACDAEYLKIEFDSTKPDGQFRKDVSSEKLMSLIPGFTFTPLEEGIRQTYIKAIELDRFKI